MKLLNYQDLLKNHHLNNKIVKKYHKYIDELVDKGQYTY